MELKNLVNILRFGGRFIIIDTDGNPKAVLMSYQEFEELMVDKVAGKLIDELKEVERVNEEITRAQLTDLREEVLKEDFVITTQQTMAFSQYPEIRVEPLPDNIEEEFD
ncbi:MAG: hypothetical protein A2751_03865 [Candidatus Doudnabacteria bacterium RIFCSPHIGHO2_01_FULL_46_14]|uniref:Antitoxin n=1 Tax=Candidatus Doudnabacteria bacterium RIFCSPHIGHO2_01_FULL_46_14 TaxID=1817824 RepID=A0A1F5NKN0_9BACT|nr:MAG: hypothetical protein A2751_03865 [Candidatus Doudnabacteria bacterium RIFCSPHIGHO2_01_FULL_46_14]